MPAKSLDSYRDTLYAILDEFKPMSVIEWGPGLSTQIMALHPSVVSVLSIEHNPLYHEEIANIGLMNTDLVLQEDMIKYPKEHGGLKYDLAFVDGRNRAQCLVEAKLTSPIVILHDAAREQYRQALRRFKYQIWTDDGNTVTLTDSDSIAIRATQCLHDLICGEPPVEKIRITMAGELAGDIP